MRLVYATSVSLIGLAAVSAASDLEIDLAALPPGSSVTLPVVHGTVDRIVVVNRIPTATYEVRVSSDVVPLEPLDKIAPGGFAPLGQCSERVKSAQELRSGQKKWTEATVRDRVAELLDGLEQCSGAQIDTINGEIAHTRFALTGPFEVPRGTRLNITVSRNEADKVLTWTRVLEGGSRGRWLTTYGFGVVDDKDERYFSKSEGEGKFSVAQETVPEGYKAIPSVYFIWLPGQNENRNFSHGPTAGFGLKNDTPSVFLGYSLMYNWNIGIIAGGSLVSETRLKGQYVLGQSLSENLTPDALQARTFRPRWSVSVVFRFGANPFSSSQSASAPGKAPDKPSPEGPSPGPQ